MLNIPTSKNGDPLHVPFNDDAIIALMAVRQRGDGMGRLYHSTLRMKGTALEDIADLLGYKSLGMTRRFSHLAPSKLHDVVARLNSGSTPVAPAPKPEIAVPVSYVN